MDINQSNLQISLSKFCKFLDVLAVVLEKRPFCFLEIFSLYTCCIEHVVVPAIVKKCK